MGIIKQLHTTKLTPTINTSFVANVADAQADKMHVNQAKIRTITTYLCHLFSIQPVTIDAKIPTIITVEPNKAIYAFEKPIGANN
jgi:hypothetical protein